jgi:RNA polymerase sigma factor for flagellar operon FliA
MDIFMRTSSAKTAALQITSIADREGVILKHLPQIRCVARKICAKLPTFIDANDLIGDGVLGLLDAVEKYDPGRGVSFKTYAQYRIRGAMLDNLRNQDWTPRSVRQKSRKLVSTRQSIEMLLGRAPTEEEMANAMDISLGKLHELMEKVSGMKMRSLSEPKFSDHGAPDQMPSKEDPSNLSDPFSNLFQSEIRCLLAAAIDYLPDRERTIISLYYYEDLTMAEIGQCLNLNGSRISQIHSRAMMMLRTRLGALSGPDNCEQHTESRHANYS